MGTHFFKKPGPRAKFKNDIAVGKGLGNLGVPIRIDAPKERLRRDDISTQTGRVGVVHGQPPRERMLKDSRDHHAVWIKRI
jgi:hypothetical protein